MNSERANTLRADSISFIESLSQTIGAVGPSAGLALVIPLVFAKAGNSTWFVFALSILGFLFLAFVFRIFASRTASAGGLGNYGALAFGRWGGAAVSWTYILTMVYAVASAAPAIVYYAGLLAHDLTGRAPSTFFNIATLTGTVALAAVIAYFGIKLSTDLMLIIECISLGAIFLLLAFSLSRAPHWVDHKQLLPSQFAGANFPLAFVTGFMCLCGFETVTALGEETQRAVQTIPRVILCCIIPIGLIFVGVSYCLVLLFENRAVPLDRAAPFEALATGLGLPWLGALVSAGVLLSFFALLLGSVNAGARVLYDLSKKGDLWRSFSLIEPSHGSPFLATIAICFLGWAVPLLVLGFGASLDNCIAYLIQLSSFAYIASYLLVIAAAPIYLHKRKELGAGSLAVCVAAFLILGFVAFLNIYPIPAWPWSILPYAFAASIIGSMLLTILIRASRPRAS